MRSRNKRTREALIGYYVRRGRLLRVRRGLYAVVPLGSEAKKFNPDPYLLAGKMAEDAVLAYHTALEVHGKAHSNFELFYYLTQTRSRSVSFRGRSFEPIRFPSALSKKHREFYEVSSMERSGGMVRVTSLERTLVDVLDRPDLSGGWEEIWRSLESVEFFDIKKIVKYALLLRNATTVAKVGFFLWQHRETLLVEEKHLAPLKKHLPKNPHYLERDRRSNGRFVPEWNLVVPVQVFERSWEEPGS